MTERAERKNEETGHTSAKSGIITLRIIDAYYVLCRILSVAEKQTKRLELLRRDVDKLLKQSRRKSSR